MISRIYKYQLPLQDVATVQMPYGACILSVGVQRDSVVVWANVDPKVERMIDRRFRIIGTGHEFDDTYLGRFVGTVMVGDALVFHIFEQLESIVF